MGAKSKIEWTDATWNPIRGCSRVSEGCRHCYAERVAAHPRLSGPGKSYEGLAVMKTDLERVELNYLPVKRPHWTGEVRLIEEALDLPLHWRKPRRIFVNSMSDLFHEKVPDTWISWIFARMAGSPQHTFQILTKRATRMKAWTEMVEENVPRLGCDPHLIVWPGPDGQPVTSQWPLPNVQLGVSVEDEPTARKRIVELLHTPAAVRWVSYEPALGGVDFTPHLPGWECDTCHAFSGPYETEPEHPETDCPAFQEGNESYTGTYGAQGRIDWVVCGGESGPGARPMHPDWARGVRDQCVAAGVPFFFKQWGEWAPSMMFPGARAAFTQIVPDGRCFPILTQEALNAVRGPGKAGYGMSRFGKKAAGRLLDGREWNEMPKGTETAFTAEGAEAAR